MRNLGIEFAFYWAALSLLFRLISIVYEHNSLVSSCKLTFGGNIICAKANYGNTYLTFSLHQSFLRIYSTQMASCVIVTVKFDSWDGRKAFQKSSKPPFATLIGTWLHYMISYITCSSTKIFRNLFLFSDDFYILMIFRSSKLSLEIEI